jgi:hypothetical protein
MGRALLHVQSRADEAARGRERAWQWRGDQQAYFTAYYKPALLPVGVEDEVEAKIYGDELKIKIHDLQRWGTLAPG